MHQNVRGQYVHPTNVGLPGDEYKMLKERHNSKQLQSHLGDVYARHDLGMQGPLRRGQFDARGPNPDVHYRKPVDTTNAGRSRTPKYADRVLQKSKVANATRRALGPSWYPNEEPIPEKYLQEFDRTMYEYDEDNPHAKRKYKEEDPIPDKYLQEFNRLWYEDDEDNDADQLLADLLPNSQAPWRVHAPIRPMYGPDVDFDTSIDEWYTTGSTELSRTSFHTSRTGEVDFKPEPVLEDEDRRWSGFTLNHREDIFPKLPMNPEPQSFFDWSDSPSPDRSQRKMHPRMSKTWKRLTKGFRQSGRE